MNRDLKRRKEHSNTGNGKCKDQSVPFVITDQQVGPCGPRVKERE